MCKSANLHLHEKLGKLKKHTTGVMHSTRVSGTDSGLFLWGREFKFSCSCPKTFQFQKDEMHTQKFSAHYLWFSVLVVNSVAWSVTVTVKLDVFAVFWGFIFFVQGCHKSEFLAPNQPLGSVPVTQTYHAILKDSTWGAWF